MRRIALRRRVVQCGTARQRTAPGSTAKHGTALHGTVSGVNVR